MKPPGTTTLARMQRTAMLEAERIEISQDARVNDGSLKEPMPYQVDLRDDYAGMVRLIDAIMSEQSLLDRVKIRMAAKISTAKPSPKLIDPDADVAVDVEVDD
jgi:hypothetical protein